MNPGGSVEVVKTEVFDDQKPGTSGLRKQVKVFRQRHYLENFIQAIYNHLLRQRRRDVVLVVGGDGRYYTREAISIIVQMAIGNGLKKLIIGKDGILSTPAASHLIRKYKASGGILLTASHNPGGPDHDFGVKFNTCSGGPAPKAITDEIYEETKRLETYALVPRVEVDLSTLGEREFPSSESTTAVEIIDPVADYVTLMKSIYDFDKLKKLIKGSEERKPFKVLIDSMSGVTGPYVRKIFMDELGADADGLLRTTPLEDFGGCHPDPNLTYAKDLVDKMRGGSFDFGAAFDGDGDRNMILGERASFVNPSDSLAVIADHVEAIPYFKANGVSGFARSMPTGAAVDRVAEAKNVRIYEVPTGWKYFGNLLNAGQISICGEESFGTGSDHIREKDGIWAALAWLSIIEDSGLSVREIMTNHWRKYGRNYFTRYDYEDCDSDKCERVIAELQSVVSSRSHENREIDLNGEMRRLVKTDSYSYFDEIDKTLSEGNGIRFMFQDGSRIIYRISGTGSSGTTIRIYIEAYEKDFEKCCQDPQVVLKPLIDFALSMSKLEEYTGRKAPTVIT